MLGDFHHELTFVTMSHQEIRKKLSDVLGITVARGQISVREHPILEDHLCVSIIGKIDVGNEDCDLNLRFPDRLSDYFERSGTLNNKERAEFDAAADVVVSNVVAAVWNHIATTEGEQRRLDKEQGIEKKVKKLK